MLRCHPPPNEKKLQEVHAALARHDLHIDIKSAGALQASLLSLQRKGLAKGLMDSISQLLLRTMNVRTCCAHREDEHNIFALQLDAAYPVVVARPQRSVIAVCITPSCQVARYFCTGLTESDAEWIHYALAVDRYTHFTSPIRRFPDIEVHRLLAAAIGEGQGAYVAVVDLSVVVD